MNVNTLNWIHWLGHDGFRIEAGPTIYIDPYEMTGHPPKADILLITHQHHDHFSPDDVAKVATDQTDIVSIEAVIGNVTIGRPHTVAPNQKLTVRGVEIETVPAYNVDKKFHPKSAGHVGFIVTVHGQRVYHAGDTDLIPEMADFKVDIALLPVSGTYVMTANEAVQAAARLKPKLAIPMHYGAIIGGVSDAELFVAGCTAQKISTHVLEKEA